MDLHGLRLRAATLEAIADELAQVPGMELASYLTGLAHEELAERLASWPEPPRVRLRLVKPEEQRPEAAPE